MRTIRFKGINTFVMFRHDDAVRLGKKGLEHVEVTTCAIFTAEGVRQLAGGLSVKSENDESDDMVGVEKSLGRALQKLTDDKSERAAYWAAFRASVAAEQTARYDAELEGFLAPASQEFGEGDFDPEPVPGVSTATQTVGGYGVAAPGTPSYVGRDGVDYDLPYLGAQSNDPSSRQFTAADDPYSVDFSRGLRQQFENEKRGTYEPPSNVLPFVKPVNSRIAELESKLKAMEADHNGPTGWPGESETCSSCKRVRAELAEARAAA